ncbi:MAG TPA: CGNR zinc finger domain-containing protein [Pseudonocardia sp.]|uniref:CGNR zinc finger domain-containing protein n=1 Tax=Pseudonocardia sp. TaxID=60912 RepID=UPI002B4AEB5C|nr:CGNR zinc finger domain-containing protein [Pseudonocardia sp.]HLU60397.1 CGNR zinc finger domain-containing protein [Pseudonocardia sp.]
MVVHVVADHVPLLGVRTTPARRGRHPSGDRRGRLRACAADDCRMIVADTSQGRRPWCSMEACGNRAKAAEHRARAQGDRRDAISAAVPAYPGPSWTSTPRAVATAVSTARWLRWAGRRPDRRWRSGGAGRRRAGRAHRRSGADEVPRHRPAPGTPVNVDADRLPQPPSR